MAMKSKDYWRQRAEAVAKSQHKDADKAVRQAERYFREADLSIRKEIEAWYARYSFENGISLAEARKQLDARELEGFRWTVEQYIDAATNGDLSPFMAVLLPQLIFGIAAGILIYKAPK